MTGGRLIAVVGPSGVGKDTVIDALCAEIPGLVRARRTITRSGEARGEDFESADAARFLERERAGDFALSWEAHGLRYGVPASIRSDLDAGHDVTVNLSRRVLDEARRLFPGMRVLSLTARPEVLAMRLSGRGRETAEDIAERLARAQEFAVSGDDVIRVDNSGSLAESVAAARAALYPESA